MFDDSKKFFESFEELYDFVVEEEKLDKDNILEFNITNNPNDMWNLFNMGIIYNKVNKQKNFLGYELIGFIMMK